MSFILDALKKSESERQRTNAPGIADVPVGIRRSGAPRWLWPLSGLLAVNLVVLLVVLLKPAPPAAPPPAVAEPAASPLLPAAEARPADRETRAPAAGVAPTPPVTATTDEIPRDASPPSAPPATERVARPAPANSQALLTFNDVMASGNVNLGDLHIDIHVYSDDPSDRFVFINMNQYRENTTLAEGPLLREITTEGVILEYAGTTFLLPRE